VILKSIIFLGAILLGGTGHHSSDLVPTGQQTVTGENKEEDKAGPYVITNRDATTGEKDAQIRSFLWEHWRDHRRGRLIEKRYSKEGVPATTTFVIEPDERGVWALRVTRRWPPTKGSTPEHDRAEYRVYSIKRIQPRRDSRSPVIFFSDGEKRSGNTYWLVFYDEKGKEMSAL
jgi:hypothetical protein